MICPKHPILSRTGSCGCVNDELDPNRHLLEINPEDLLLQADAEACRRSLTEFFEYFWPEIEPQGRPYVKNMATDAILQHLQAVGDGQIRRLAIAAAPGQGKSACCSVAFPAWMWAKDPSWKVICASYAMKLSRDIADRFYRLITSDKYIRLFPEVRIESGAIEKLSTTASGRRYAVGLDGAITGLRGNCGIVDDSINAQDMTSASIQQANKWFGEAFNTRFEDTPKHNASMIVVQQRFVQHDLIDYMRDLGAEVLELPAKYELGRHCKTYVGVGDKRKEFWTDPRTKEGELIAPGIHSEESLERHLKVLMPHGFAAQFQQRPSPREGNLFKMAYWDYFNLDGDTNPRVRLDGARTSPSFTLKRDNRGTLDLDWVCVSMDPTGGSLKETASAVGLTIVGGKGQRRFILEDIYVGPRGPSDQIEDVKRAIVRAGVIAGKQRSFKVLIEKKALGVGVYEQIERGIKEGQLRYPDGAPIVAEIKYYEPSGKGSKGFRADHLEPDMMAGLIYLHDGATWVPSYVEEFGLFPLGGGRDDRVDALAQCLDEYRQTYTDNQWTTAAKKVGLFR